MTQKTSIYQKIKTASEAIQSRCTHDPELGRPKIGIILGSGLGALADQVTNPVILPYSEIPYFHGTAVEGHAGKMILGRIAEIPIVFLQGRFHLYEGHPMEDVVFPTRILCSLGIHTLIVTNAAGGINTRFRPADIMFIEDHLNLMGDNPLKGPHLPELGPRFPDLSEAYNKGCLEIIKSTAKNLNIPFQSGVYAGLLGPTYETPAEVRMLRTLGADAVGMSTVPETIAANHCGVKVIGISCITNLAAGLSPHPLSHAEVMEVSKGGSEKMQRLLMSVLPQLTSSKSSL